MNNNILTTLAVATLALAAAAWRQPADPLRVREGSLLWAEGKSTVRDWKCAATTLDAAVDAQSAAVAGVLAGEKAVRTVTLDVAVAKMDCSNGTMNEHMRKALKEKEHPTISFRMESYDLAAVDSARMATLTGTLKIGGTEKPVAISARLTAGPDGALRVTGTYELLMSDFGLKAPSLMLGTMKVKDRVVVGFDILLTN